MKEIREIFGVNCIGTPKQLETIYKLQNHEKYWEDEFKKYFHVWTLTGTGVFFFVKEKYFHDLNGITNYAAVLLDKFGRN